MLGSGKPWKVEEEHHGVMLPSPESQSRVAVGRVSYYVSEGQRPPPKGCFIGTSIKTRFVLFYSVLYCTVLYVLTLVV